MPEQRPRPHGAGGHRAPEPRAPLEEALPQPCVVRAAVAIAAFDALKRLPVPVGEDRRRAKEDALELLDKVAQGRITPEGDGEADDESRPATSPLADDGPPRTLGGPLW